MYINGMNMFLLFKKLVLSEILCYVAWTLCGRFITTILLPNKLLRQCCINKNQKGADWTVISISI